MTTKKIDLDVLVGKTICLIALLLFGTPAAIASYIWQAITAGWAFGEWAFDPDTFYERYGGRKRNADD